MSLPTPYYQDDAVTLYHGDCREILPLLPEASVDLVLTDPPYGHNNNNNGDLIHRREAALGLPATHHGAARPIANDGPEANDLVRWMFSEAARLLKDASCCCCCCGGGGPDPQFARWSLWMDEPLDFVQAVVWDKGGLGMGWHYRRNYEFVLVARKKGGGKLTWNGGNTTANVVRLNGLKPFADDHPTPKPEPLMAHFIRLHTNPGMLIVDPFAGGGTALVAAKREGRKAIGVEVSEEFCALAARRLAQEVIAL